MCRAIELRADFDGDKLRWLGVRAGTAIRHAGTWRWRLCKLVTELQGHFEVSVDETTIGRALRKMGYCKLSARPKHHAKNEVVVGGFRKPSPLSLQRSKHVSASVWR